MESSKEDRLVEGFGNVSIVDSQGDFVPITRMSELMPTYMKRGGILMDSHTNRHIGNILHWELRDKDGKDAIYLWAKIFNDYSIDNMVWKAIGNKHYTGFSFGGRSIDKDIKCDEGICFNNIKDLEVWEWSIVPKPANKESTFTKFNEIAKGDRMSTVLVPRMENGDIVYDTAEMPMDDGILNKADTEIEKARGQRQTSAKEYGEMEDVSGEIRRAEEGPQKPLRGGDNRFRQKKFDETMSQVYGSKHGEADRREAEIYDKEHPDAPSYGSTRMRDKAMRIGKRTDRETEKMDDYQAPIDEEKGCKEEEKMDETDKKPNLETEKMDNEEVAKEDTPMTAPAEDAGNPMNKIISMLESIENRLTDLEGGAPAPEVEEKAELEDMPMEEEKAETPKKVTVPEPQKQQEDKILNKGEETPERLSDIVGELKKMGYDKVTTPKPSVSAEFPFSGGQTVGDLLNKSDTGVVDIHSQLGSMSFKEIDHMFKGE